MDGMHRVLMRRQWSDLEPDTLYVSLELDGSSGMAFVVFSGNATFLTTTQAREVRDYIDECLARAEQHRAEAAS